MSNLLKGKLETIATYTISLDFDLVMAQSEYKLNLLRETLHKLGYVEEICFDHDCWITFQASAKGEEQAFGRYETIAGIIDSILQR